MAWPDALQTSHVTGETIAAATDNAQASYINNLVSQRVINVRDPVYGAVGDGVNDDTAEITAAVTVATAAGGGTVRVPTGTYLLSSAIAVPNFVHLRGDGQGSVLRCSGNHYAVNITGSRCRVSDMWIEKNTGTQSSGGGIDMSSAGDDVWVEDIYFGSRLFYYINAAPTSQHSVWKFRRLRANYATSTNTGFRFGDGTALLTDVVFEDVTGTAGTDGDMGTWMDVARNVDTLIITGATFYNGTTGVVLGNRGSSGAVTGLVAESLVVDSLSGIGIDAQNVTTAEFGDTCMIQTCGSSTSPGLKLQAGAKHITYSGAVRNCTGDGVLLQANATYTRLVGASIFDNNTGNTAALSGVTVAANVTNWEIVGCFIGNEVIGGGNQKYAVNIGAGTTDQWTISDCFLHRNATAPINDTSVGNFKVQSGNLATDAAGTGLGTIDEITPNAVNVRKAGTDRVRLLTNGQVVINNEFAANPALAINTGGVFLNTVGHTLNVKEGTNAKMGTATLVGGTVTVSTTAVTATSRILLTGQNSSGTHGELTVSARTAGTKLVITSASGSDTRLVAWLILEPA